MAFYKQDQIVLVENMDGKFVEFDQASVEPEQKPFLKKWWWIITPATLLVTILIIIFAIIPAISRNLVANSNLTIQSLAVLSPTPTDFKLNMRAMLDHATSFAPILDAFNISMYIPTNNPEMIPFSSSLVPALVAKSPSSINLEQMAPILDLEQFTTFSRNVVTQAELQLAIMGQTVLRLGGLPPVSVIFMKVLTLKGLNGLTGFTTTNLRLLAKTAADGSNLLGDANIPNPSVMTVALGNMTFNLLIKGTLVGTASIQNVQLEPGNNTFPMRANISIAEIAKGVDLATGMAVLSVMSNSTVYSGKHLSYFENALAGNMINTTIKVADIETNAVES